MITNTDLTIYNKVYDRDTGTNRYYRTVLKGVNWQDTTAVQPDGKGIASADVAEVYIPFTVETEKQYRKPENFMAEADKSRIFTFREGDLLVRGITETELGSTKDEEYLKNSCGKVRSAAMVEFNDSGSIEIQHWKVTAE